MIPFVNNEFPADSLTFSFSGNASVQAGGGIVADFAGYAAAQGPGQGRSYSFGSTNVDSGGGHGGYGGGSLANSGPNVLRIHAEIAARSSGVAATCS